MDSSNLEDSPVVEDPSEIDESSVDQTIKSPSTIASPANTSTEVKKVISQIVSHIFINKTYFIFFKFVLLFDYHKLYLFSKM